MMLWLECTTATSGLILWMGFGSPLAAGIGAPGGKLAAERPILIQASDAERVWKGIKDTPSPAVLNAFIARHKNTRFADLARERLEKIKPKESTPQISSLDEKATTEQILRELPIDPSMLRLVEAHPFFSSNLRVGVGSYALTRSDTQVYGGYATTIVTDEKATVWPVRGSLVRLEVMQDDSTTQGKVTTKYKRQNLEIHAGNGLLELASKTVGVGRPGSDQVSTLIGLRNVQGSVFPLKKGNRFSWEATYRQIDATAPEQFTSTRSCQIVDDRDATALHPKLSGRAFFMNCRFETVYRRSKRYTGNMGIGSGNTTSVFITQLGIWLDVSGSYSLKAIDLR